MTDRRLTLVHDVEWGFPGQILRYELLDLADIILGYFSEGPARFFLGRDQTLVP